MPTNRRDYAKAHYEANKGVYKQRAADFKKKAVRRNREFLREHLLGHPCVECGEPDPALLKFDSGEGEDPVRVSRMASQGVSIERLQSGITKCEVRCVKCLQVRRSLHKKKYPSSSVKDKQLGMPIGTASGRLRKMVMLRLLQRLGEDICFKCKKQIKTAEELSLEHKKSWLHVDPALFWDLDNVTFSHRACNRPDRPSHWRRKVGPLGTAWCGRCQKFFPKEQFLKNSNRWNGCDDYCKACRRTLRKR